MIVPLCLVLLIACGLFVVAMLPLRGLPATVLALWTVCYAQIVLIAQVLSEGGVFGPVGFVCGHALLTGLVGWAWWRRACPHLLKPYRVRNLTGAVRRRPMLAAFAGLTLALALVNLALGTVFPTATEDPIYYHLPRAYAWLQHGTARHFITTDFRMTEFPPNASFVYAWLMLDGVYGFLHVPMFLAALVTVAGTVALARLAGFGRGAALFGGLLLLHMPMTIVASASKQIDMLAASVAVAFVVLSVKALRGERVAYVYAGAAFGLLLGTKYTVFFLLPGAALTLIALAFARYVFVRPDGLPPPLRLPSRDTQEMLGVGRRLTLARVLRRLRNLWDAVSRLVLLLVACAVGFGLLGAYNYVLNNQRLGNPVTSVGIDTSSALYDPAFEAAFYNGPGNVARYVYQTMDWTVLPGFATADDSLFLGHLWLYRALDDALSLRLEAVPRFTELYAESTGRRETQVGFGPVGYGLLLIAPFAFVWAAARRKLSAWWLFIGLSWLVLFAWLAPWSPWKTRYFPIFMPFLVAGMLPGLLRRRWLAALLMLSALWVQQDYTFDSFDRRAKIERVVSGDTRGLWRWDKFFTVSNRMYAEFADREDVTVAVESVPLPMFILVVELPNVRWVQLQDRNFRDALTFDGVDAVLVDRQRCLDDPGMASIADRPLLNDNNTPFCLLR